MYQQQNGFMIPVAELPATERVTFIRKTYAHLAGAVAAFIAIEAAILSTPLGAQISQTLLGTKYGWLVVLGMFMAVGWVAEKWAQSATSVTTQYAGLGLYVVAQAIVFVPLLYIAQMTFGASIIAEAGVYTAFVFAGLTGTVFFTKKDFSFLRGILMIGGFAAMGVIVASILFGFSLGTLFAAAMILLAGGYILFHTSNVLHHYPVGSHVAASLALFSSVAILFWYILRLLMALRR